MCAFMLFKIARNNIDIIQYYIDNNDNIENYIFSLEANEHVTTLRYLNRIRNPNRMMYVL